MLRATLACLTLALAAGCATRPASDGPERSTPPDLMRVPDALPKIEPIREAGPNKPYEAQGQRYTPLPADAAYAEDGLASWYGRKFHGQRTASGELYNMYAMTAAHKTLPIPSYARVTNPANGRSIIVRVNDRGPFVKGRVIDLSYTAALKLSLLNGVAPVRVERITPEAIRSGAWRGVPVEGDEPPAAAPIAATPPPPPAEAPREETTPQRAMTTAARGFWVQLGAFRERGGAMQLQQQAAERVEGLSLLLAVFSEASLHRVQAGPFASRDEAARVAERVRAQMLLTPVVVERR